MIYLETYKDFIGNGSYNKVYELDDDWVIKSPIMKDYLLADYTTKDILEKFKDHIDTMKMYPDIFPKVKKLDKYRVAVERLNTERAKEEINHIFEYLSTLSVYDPIHFKNKNDILYKLIYGNYFNKQLKEGDEICKKWFDFTTKVKNSNLIKEQELDISEDNVGIDKEGNIKLLDF